MKSMEKLEEATSLYKKAVAIHEKGDSATEEEKALIPKYLEEARILKTQSLDLQNIEKTGRELAAAIEGKDTAKLEGGGAQWSSWGEFLKTVFNWSRGYIQDDPRLFVFDEKASKGYPIKDMAESTGAAGGFLVPAQYLEELQSVMAEASFVRPRATIIRIRRRQVNIPVLDQTGTTAGQPHWYGGMQVFWAEEAEQKDFTEPKFRQIELVAHKMVAYTRASDELVDDAAISLDDFLRGPLGFAGAAVWYEEYAFLRGTGAGQPLGIIPAPATITVPRAVAGAIGFADLANMMENFLPSSKGVWIITQSALADIIQLSGPAGNPSYIWQPNAREGVPGYLLGYPVIWTEKCPRIGSTGDVILADLKYYLIGDRQATTIESTKLERWRYDQTSWKLVHRVDGQPWLSRPLTYEDGTTQVSPFVILGGAVAS